MLKTLRIREVNGGTVEMAQRGNGSLAEFCVYFAPNGDKNVTRQVVWFTDAAKAEASMIDRVSGLA